MQKNGSEIIYLGKKVPRTFRKFIIFQYRSTDIPLNDVAVLRLEVPIDFHFFPYVRSGKKKGMKIRIYFFLCQAPVPPRPHEARVRGGVRRGGDGHRGGVGEDTVRR